MPIKIHFSRLLGEHKVRAAEVSRRTGIDKNTLSSLYREDAKGIRFSTLEKLCKFFHCKINNLIEYVPKK